MLGWHRRHVFSQQLREKENVRGDRRILFLLKEISTIYIPQPILKTSHASPTTNNTMPPIFHQNFAHHRISFVPSNTVSTTIFDQMLRKNQPVVSTDLFMSACAFVRLKIRFPIIGILLWKSRYINPLESCNIISSEKIYPGIPFPITVPERVTLFPRTGDA